MTTAKAYSLHVGLNALNPAGYGGWNGQLYGCENDANDMATIAVAAKFTQTKTLLTRAATADAVLGQLRAYCALAQPGDLILFTNSSHGGQIWDQNGDEADGVDETICMYDREVIDDEIAAVWSTARAGVRGLSISDSCHAGTVVRAFSIASQLHGRTQRSLPPSVARLAYEQNQTIYDPILKDPALREFRGQVQASVLHLGACMDNQTSYDGARNGLFTEKLRQVWDSGRFVGTYGSLVSKIRRLMPSDQTPDYRYLGPRDAKFEASQPFTF